MLNQPVALVTGGSRGIGRAICVALAARGYAVAVNFAGNRAAAGETENAVGERAPVKLVPGDVANAEDRTRIVAETVQEWGRLDVLVNNAGITSPGRLDLLEATEVNWDRVLGVNLKGPYFLSQLAAREMIRLGKQVPRPCIVNVSSLSAFAASVNRGDYCVSKSGLSMVTQLFALRLAEHGIRVFEVRPGIIDTDMTAAARDRYVERITDGLTPIRRIGTAADVGEAIASLVCADLPYSTGDIWHVDGGYHLRKL